MKTIFFVISALLLGFGFRPPKPGVVGQVYENESQNDEKEPV